MIFQQPGLRESKYRDSLDFVNARGGTAARLAAIILCALASTTTALAYSYSIDRSSCSLVESRIARVEREMSRGYSIQRGEQLRDQLRQLKAQKSRCRQQDFPTSR